MSGSHHVKWLVKAAEEIRAEGHAGWGNTCEEAAAAIQVLNGRIASLEDALKPFAEAWKIACDVVDTGRCSLGHMGVIAGYNTSGTHYQRAALLLNTMGTLGETAEQIKAEKP